MTWHGAYLDDLRKRLPFQTVDGCQVSVDSDFIAFCGPFPRWSREDPCDDAEIVQDFQAYCSAYLSPADGNSSEKHVVDSMVQVLKYTFAFGEMIGNLLSEDMLNGNHFPYLLEASVDIGSDLVLSSKGCYKQALALLRCALENTVSHFFHSSQGNRHCDSAMDVGVGRKRFRVGLRGMSSYLVESGYISADLQRSISRCYGRLGAFVHSELASLTVCMSDDQSQKAAKVESWAANSCATMNCLLLLVISMMEGDRRLDAEGRWVGHRNPERRPNQD